MFNREKNAEKASFSTVHLLKLYSKNNLSIFPELLVKPISSTIIYNILDEIILKTKVTYIQFKTLNLYHTTITADKSAHSRKMNLEQPILLINYFRKYFTISGFWVKCTECPNNLEKNVLLTFIILEHNCIWLHPVANISLLVQKD